MKSIFTVIFLSIYSSLSAQWSNTTNQFYDSLHSSVCTAAGEQVNSLVIKSYPDSGYFVIWEDRRAGYYAPTQIFAQKYDKTGKQLWANDGIPVSTGTNSQHFTYASNNDYRNYSIAATDSAGGIYIGYVDDSVSTYVWERLMVQHILSDGKTVFSDAGANLYTSDQANQQLNQQLIADGNRGFFISYLKGGYGTMDLYVYCYKDNNGTLKNYGGGLVSQNGFTVWHTGYCGNYTTVEYFQTYVIDYEIYPDLQKGCNVVMTFSQNGGISNTNERIQTAFNWLWRVKKDVTTGSDNFLKDQVRLFYVMNVESGNLICKDDVNNIVYNYPTGKLISNGFLPVSDWLYSAERVRGTTVQTDGNINANIVVVNQRNVSNNVVSDFFTRVYYRKQQKFDDIPYEFKVSPYLPSSIFGVVPPGQNKLGTYSGNNNDTLLYDAGATYYYDFSLASGGNKIFATGIMNNGARNVLLQQLQVQKITNDSFAVQLNTASKNGIRIGKERSTGFSGTDISYNNPQVTVDNNGNGLFYILETGRSTRVSPIGNGAELTWGAMGKPTGTGRFKGQYYTPNKPFIQFDPVNGTGVLSWNDSRYPSSTGNNIYLRHLDNLNADNYMPPNLLVKQLVNPYGATTAAPAVLLGASKKFTTINAFSGYSGYDVTTPVVEILDNYNLGAVTVSVFENTGAIRKYNGKPYLDRNYNITPENNPAGAATINVRLYFTQSEFDALKAADPSITSPADLAVIKQPATGSAPPSFIFVAGASTIFPQSWAAVPGGYYIEIAVPGFSNFFIQGPTGALPVTWLDVNAQWADDANAKVSWQVADQVNIKNYHLQHSYDGSRFENVCEIAATNSEYYYCTVPAERNIINYYRILQLDLDGKSSLSKVVILNSAATKTVSIYPNPVIDEMQVTGLGNYKEFTIVNVEGKIMRKGKLNTGSQSISVQHLESGVYLLKLIGNTKMQTQKFIKK